MIVEHKSNKNKIFEADRSAEEKKFPFWKKVAAAGALLLLSFSLGLVPMWLSERETARQRDAAQANLRLSAIQNRLGSAAINVRRGEYEEARLAASDFFTDLRTEIDRPESAFSTAQREAVKPILAQRDDLITLLARNDPSTGDRLAELYLTYVKAINPPSLKPN
jgi:hypothetical protein